MKNRLFIIISIIIIMFSVSISHGGEIDNSIQTIHQTIDTQQHIYKEYNRLFDKWDKKLNRANYLGKKGKTEFINYVDTAGKKMEDLDRRIDTAGKSAMRAFGVIISYEGISYRSAKNLIQRRVRDLSSYSSLVKKKRAIILTRTELYLKLDPGSLTPSPKKKDYKLTYYPTLKQLEQYIGRNIVIDTGNGNGALMYQNTYMFNELNGTVLWLINEHGGYYKLEYHRIYSIRFLYPEF